MLPPGEVIASEFVQVLGKVISISLISYLTSHTSNKNTSPLSLPHSVQVMADGSMLEGLRVQSAGDNFDLQQYDKLVGLSHGKVKAIFAQ
jgi:hypothetical protein